MGNLTLKSYMRSKIVHANRTSNRQIKALYSNKTNFLSLTRCDVHQPMSDIKQATKTLEARFSIVARHKKC